VNGHELRLRLERGEGRVYRVVASGETGDVTGTFEVPFDERDVELFALRVSRGGKSTRRAESPELRRITEFGGALFGALFQSRVGELYRVSRNVAEAQQSSLRVTLALGDVPELMHLPWEFLYDEPEFLAISRWTPVVRYLEFQGGRRPLQVGLPLRILAVVSSPDDAVELDGARERENLEQALHGLVQRGAVEIEWLEDATLNELLRTLERGPFHVFHYIGHGAYDTQAEDGVLLLEDAANRARRVTGRELGTILADHKTLRLAVLNACEGARAASDDPFAGVATSLVQRGIPAVIAMQFEITDRAAIVFAGEFYWKLADCGTVDTALAFARQGIFADGNEVEWATPVLFMRVADGRIFDVPDLPLAHPAPAVEPEPEPEPEPEREPEREREREPEPAATNRRRPRLLLAAAVVVGAAAALVAGIVLLPDDAPRSNPAETVVVKPKHHVAWTLRGAIPAAIRKNCGAGGQALLVPGALRPIVRDGRATFTSSYACPSRAVRQPFAQYSLAASVEDLDRYFDWRTNARGVGALVTTGTCGAVGIANNRWTPSGRTGHAVTEGGGGSGRVLCYELDGQARIEWTDTRSLVYAFAQGPDRAALYRWWQSAAGPAPPA
jgi:hypothetical protein